MAKDSLYDLQFFLNRWFRRVEFPFDKSAGLPVHQVVECCLPGFQRAAIQSSSIPEVSKESDRVSGAIFGHTPVRQATRIPRGRLRAGGVVFATSTGRRHDTTRLTFRSR